MKKVAILSFYSGHIQRGVENWTMELASNLAQTNVFDVLVVQNGPKNQNAKFRQVSLNIDVKWNIKSTHILKRLFMDYWSLLIAKFSIKTLNILIKENVDIVIPTDGGWEPALIRILTWLRGKKMIIVGHSGVGWDDRNNLWCFPDVFVALSSFAKVWAAKVNPFIKVVKIPNGVDLEKFNPFGESIKLKLKKPVVLAVSALIPDKRLELIIKAVAKIKKASLFIVGKGELKDGLQKLGGRVLNNRFVLSDYSYGDMPKVYRSADVFVSASKSYYSFEMVITEALASGLPIIANYDSIRTEIVGKAGILVNPDNTDQLAAAIKKALNTSWGNRPRLQSEKFSWEVITQKYIELFRILVR